jgi:hypothetical protein
MLLTAFVGGLGHERPDNIPPYAPWSWGTMDEDLATAVGDRLRSLGVIYDELWRIKTGDENDEKVLRRVVSRIMRTMLNMLQPGSRCIVCDKGEEDISGQLRFCSACMGIRYCSVECQKADWERHKEDCKKAQKNPPQTKTARVVQPYEYSTIAPTKDEAQKLAYGTGIKFRPGEHELE